MKQVTSDDLKDPTKDFAHRCVKLTQALPNSSLGRHLRSQLIRCSTSVAANYRAACSAQSKASFIAKLSVVIEEADESAFWLEFIVDEHVLKKERVEPLIEEGNELTAIFTSSRKTAQSKK